MASTITKDQLQSICTNSSGKIDYKLVDELYKLFYNQQIPISFQGVVTSDNSASLRFDSVSSKIYIDIRLNGVLKSFQIQTV